MDAGELEIKRTFGLYPTLCIIARLTEEWLGLSLNVSHAIP